jgi:hypothetical protein
MMQQHDQRPLILSPPGVPKASYGLPSRSVNDGVSFVRRGRLPGAGLPGSPGSSQNVCARVL